MSNIGSKSELLISRFAGFLNILGMAFIAIAMFMTTVDVIMRYFFVSPIPGAYYLTGFLLVGIIAFPLAHVQEKKAHVRVDIAIVRVPDKARAAIELTTVFLTLLLFGLATYTGVKDAWRSFVEGAYIGVVEYPLWPSKCFLFIGTGTLCLRLAVDAVHYGKDLFRSRVIHPGF